MLGHYYLNQHFIHGGLQLSDPITMQTSRSLALLLGTAAISIVLTSPAHADVIIDQQQLTGQGKSVAEQAYGDVRQVRSPLGGISILPVSNEPVVISSRGAGTKSSLAASANAPIALKPLSKWGLAVPATPISTGARTAILLKPPGNVNQVINQLAKQSPLRNAPMQTADATPSACAHPASTAIRTSADAQYAGHCADAGCNTAANTNSNGCSFCA